MASMNNSSLQIRLSDRRKHKLMLYAAQKDRTITTLIEEWIDSLVLEKEKETAG
jgi:predicted transcriptional regulator